MVALINKVDGHCHEVVPSSVLTQHFLSTGALRKPEFGLWPARPGAARRFRGYAERARLLANDRQGQRVQLRRCPLLRISSPSVSLRAFAVDF